MPAQLLSERVDSTLVLTISNPEARNALHPDIYAGSKAALDAAAADDSIRAVISTAGAVLKSWKLKKYFDDNGTRQPLELVPQDVPPGAYARPFTLVTDDAGVTQTLSRAPLAGEPRELVPCVPIFAQGWALLGPMGVNLMPALAALRTRLRPGVFTQFEPGAT